MSEALRLYYHAKWLAERNHATAAEWRYREASRLALQTRRKVLAAHALGRFGCADGIGLDGKILEMETQRKNGGWNPSEPCTSTPSTSGWRYFLIHWNRRQEAKEVLREMGRDQHLIKLDPKYFRGPSHKILQVFLVGNPVGFHRSIILVLAQ